MTCKRAFPLENTHAVGLPAQNIAQTNSFISTESILISDSQVNSSKGKSFLVCCFTLTEWLIENPGTTERTGGL